MCQECLDIERKMKVSAIQSQMREGVAIAGVGYFDLLFVLLDDIKVENSESLSEAKQAVLIEASHRARSIANLLLMADINIQKMVGSLHGG